MGKKKIQKKIQAAFAGVMLLVVTISTVLPSVTAQAAPDATAPASSEAIVADGYVVVDVDSGEVVLQRNMNDRYFPASTTKVMTALVTIENVPDLSQTLTFSDWAINSLTWDSSTLTPEAAVGEQMSVLNTLYGMMLVSGNECANALAEYTAGSQEAFADLMNQKATELGAANTHFVNAHGLHDENHYTTPYDLYLIFKAALDNPTFYKIDSTPEYEIPATNMNGARKLSMGHQMVVGNYDYPAAIAGKTGQTDQAGRTLVTYAEQDGIRLISVIMKSTNDAFYDDTKKLLDEGFSIREAEKEKETEKEDGVIRPSEAGTISMDTEAAEESTIAITDESGKTSILFYGIVGVFGFCALVAIVLIVLIVRDLITGDSDGRKRTKR